MTADWNLLCAMLLMPFLAWSVCEWLDGSRSMEANSSYYRSLQAHRRCALEPKE